MKAFRERHCSPTRIETEIATSAPNTETLQEVLTPRRVGLRMFESGRLFALPERQSQRLEAGPIRKEFAMARPKSLAKMSIESLVELRDTVAEALTQRASELRKQLASLSGMEGGPNGRRRGRPVGRRSSLKGRKVAPKYRSKQNPKLTWAGRGAVPRWMRDEMKARKLKKEAFLIK
jgi:DNA-binding protein H-NS